MKTTFAGLAVQIKRLLRRKGLVACLLVLPLLVVLLNIFLPKGGDARNPITAGVWVPPNSARGEQLFKQLQLQNSGQLQFVRAENSRQLAPMVAGGKWECGYILDDNFDQHAQQQNWRHIVTRVTSPATSMASLLDEIFNAALLSACAPDIAAGYLRSVGILPSSAASQPDNPIADAFPAGDVMHVEVVSLQGAAAEPLPSTGLLPVPAIIRGLIAIMLLLFNFLGLLRFGTDLRSGFYTRMRVYTPISTLLFPAFVAPALLGAVAGATALVLAHVLFSGFGNLVTDLLCLLLFVLYLAAFCFLVGSLVAGGEWLAGLLPFVLVACLLLCPILIDISRFLPVVGIVSWLLPPTLYLHAADGNLAAVAVMLLGIPLWGLAGAAVLRIRGNRAPLLTR